MNDSPRLELGLEAELRRLADRTRATPDPAFAARLGARVVREAEPIRFARPGSRAGWIAVAAAAIAAVAFVMS